MSKPGTKERSKSLKRDPSKVVKMNPRMIKIEQTNFWEANGFRVDVERIDDNVQQLELLNKFFTERAEIEGDISLFYSIFYLNENYIFLITYQVI